MSRPYRRECTLEESMINFWEIMDTLEADHADTRNHMAAMSVDRVKFRHRLALRKQRMLKGAV